MNFQYFVLTLRLFVLTRDRDLRSENESSPRRRVTSVTTRGNGFSHLENCPGLAILLWKPYLLYEDVREPKPSDLANNSENPIFLAKMSGNNSEDHLLSEDVRETAAK